MNPFIFNTQATDVKTFGSKALTRKEQAFASSLGMELNKTWSSCTHCDSDQDPNG